MILTLNGKHMPLYLPTIQVHSRKPIFSFSISLRHEGVSNAGKEGYENMVRKLRERIIDGDFT